MAEQYDVIIIGGGPGGYTAAIRARQLGLRCALVERAQLGGICLNWGCIPTKALLHAAEVKHLAESMNALGLTSGPIEIDLAKIVKRSRSVAQRLVKGVAFLMKKNGVDVSNGEARIVRPGLVRVATTGGEEDLAADHIVIATGAHARTLPGLEPNGASIVTYKEAMVPTELPRKFMVVGAGAIGIEFASFYADLGSEVTVVEMADRILPQEDAEISDLAQQQLEKRGLRIHTGAKVSSAVPSGDGLTAVVDLGDGQESPVSIDQLLMAIGIAGNTDHLGLEETAVRVERSHIVVGDHQETDQPGIYAIGDVAGPPWLAHKASHEGVHCVEHIAGVPGVHRIDVTTIPACTYSRPQVASVGFTEAAARAAGHSIRIGRYPFQGNGKALAIDEGTGLIKTIVDDASGELLGAHMIGSGVTELIHGFAVARTLEARDVDLMAAVFPHPTLSEMMHESILDAADRALNI